MKKAFVTVFCVAFLWHGVQTVGKGAAKVGKGIGLTVVELAARVACGAACH